MRASLRSRSLTLLLLAAASGSLGAADAAAGVIRGAGFEEYGPATSESDSTNAKSKITGQLAKGWSDNSSWADVKVEYGADASDPHRGKKAQRITVSRVASGAVQYVQTVPFSAGRAYAFSVWMRGRPGAVAELNLRRQGAPYTQYAASNAALSAEWKEFVVEGMVGESVDGVVMIKLSGPTEVWLDDAKLSDVTSLTSDAPRQEGNLVAGGSFEAGMPFGWSTRVAGAAEWHFLDRRPVIDETTAVDGTRSYRIDLPTGTDATITSPIIKPNIQRAHAVSVWLKASQPATGVRIELEKTGIASDVRVGTEWQRFTLAGTMPFQRWTRLRLSARPEGGAPDDPKALSLWMDAVQVEEGEGTAETYRPKAPHELTLRLPRAGSIVFDGDQTGAIAVGTAPEPPAGARLRLSAVDVFGASTELPPIPLPASSIPLPAMGDRRGVFKLTAVIEDAAGAALSDPIALVWSRLPKPRELDPKTSFFGVHVQLSQDYIDIARATGQRWIRLHDSSMITKWPVVETTRGTYRFFDDAVDAAHESGIAILGMFDGAPGWTASKPREGGYWGIWHIPDLPDAPQAWEGYVRALASHYRGRIDAWEMWNEPWGDWWTGAGGSPELYAKLMKIAHDAAKQENPDAVLIGVDTYRGRDSWHDGVLAAGGLDGFDVFSFHDYNDAYYGGPDSMAKVQADTFNAAQAKHGTPKPLWNTEGGAMNTGSFYAPETGGLTLTAQLAQSVRYDVTMMGAGVQVFCYYAMHSDPAMGDTECRATECDRAIKPQMAARAVLASLVDGGGIPVRTEPVPGLDVYTWPAREGSIVTVAWSHDGASHRLPVGEAKVLDVLGNPLAADGGEIAIDNQPVYLIAPAK